MYISIYIYVYINMFFQFICTCTSTCTSKCTSTCTSTCTSPLYIYTCISTCTLQLHVPYVYMYLTSTYTSTWTCISEMSMNWASVWWGRFVCLFIKDALASSPIPLSTCCLRWMSVSIVYLIFRGLITAIKRARWPNSHEYPSMNKRPFRAI